MRSAAGPQKYKTPSPLPNSSSTAAAGSSAAKSWNPLNSLRKYGMGMSVLSDTVLSRNDHELEEGSRFDTGKHIMVEHSVDQTTTPALEGDNSSMRRLMP